jgi:hypothetical protein
LSLNPEFDCRRREKEGKEVIDGAILDLVNNFIIIDYEIVAKNKRRRRKKRNRKGGTGLSVIMVDWKQRRD